MEDFNASYGVPNFFEVPPVDGDNPPDNIFEDDDLNNSFGAASPAQENVDPDDSGASDNSDSSFGLLGLFLHARPGLNPPEDLFEHGRIPSAENRIPLGSSRESLAHLLPPGSPGTIREIFGSAVAPVDELPQVQASTNSESDASDSSGTVTCPGRSPAFLSEGESDGVLPVGELVPSGAQSLGTNSLLAFQSSSSFIGNSESSPVVLDAVAAFINHEFSLSSNDLTGPSPMDAHIIEIEAIPSTSFQAAPQPTSLNLHGHVQCCFATDSVPSTSSSQGCRPKGAILYSHNPKLNSSTDSEPSSPSHAVHQGGSPYSRRNPRRNSRTDALPSSPLHSVQEGSPYRRRNTRRSSGTLSVLPAQPVDSSAVLLSPPRFQNISSEPNFIETNQLSFHEMEVSQPLDGGHVAFPINPSSVMPPLPSSLDNLSCSSTSGRRISQCRRCSALLIRHQSSTNSDSELCMHCESCATRE